MQMLCNIIIFLPLINFFLTKIVANKGNEEFAVNISKFFAILFLILTFSFSVQEGEFQISLFELNDNIKLFLSFDKSNAYLLYILAFIWTATVFYSDGVTRKSPNSSGFDSFLSINSLGVSLLVPMIFSNNPYTMLLFYSMSILLFIFIVYGKLVVMNKGRWNNIFIIGYFFELLVVFVLSCLILKFTYLSELNGIFGWSFHLSSVLMSSIFILFIMLIFCNIINPSILMVFRQIKYRKPELFSGFFIFFALPKLLLLIYFINKFMTAGLFSHYISGFYFNVIFFILALVVILTLVIIFILEDVRKLFLVLMYNQLSMVMLAIVISSFDHKIDISSTIFCFAINLSVTFFVLNNIMSHIEESGSQTISGCFSEVKINLIMLITCFLFASSILPPVTMYSIGIISSSLDHDLNIFVLIFFINSIGMFLYGIKIFLLSIKGDVNSKEGSLSNIDFSSQLTLTPIALIFIIFISGFLI